MSRRILVLFFWLITVLVIVSTPVQALQIAVHETSNYSATQLQKMNEVIPFLENVLNSQAFRERVLNYSYEDQNGDTQHSFVQNNGMSNQEIYDFLMTGAEQAPKVTPADQTMDLHLALYRPSWFHRNVIGYTNGSTFTIFTNRYFFNRAAITDIADNYAHEWCHKMGFDHDFYNTARRKHSVPYAIGYIVEEMVANLAGL